MDTLYKVETGQSIYDDGIVTWVVKGSPVTVDGIAMVRTQHGTIVPANGWSSTSWDARRIAAMRIENIGRRLLEQAARMRTLPDGVPA